MHNLGMNLASTTLGNAMRTAVFAAITFHSTSLGPKQEQLSKTGREDPAEQKLSFPQIPKIDQFGEVRIVTQFKNSIDKISELTGNTVEELFQHNPNLVQLNGNIPENTEIKFLVNISKLSDAERITAEDAKVILFLVSRNISIDSTYLDSNTLNISDRLFNFVKHVEAWSNTAYLCPSGTPSIGIGNTSSVCMQDVTDKTTITDDEVLRLYKDDMADWSENIRRFSKGIPLTQRMFDSLVTFGFNTGAYPGTKVMDNLGDGKYAAMLNSYQEWNIITNPKTKKKEISRGLNIRRKLEIVYGLGFGINKKVCLAVEALFPKPVDTKTTPVQKQASRTNNSKNRTLIKLKKNGAG